MECTLRWAMICICIMVNGITCPAALNAEAAERWSLIARFEKMAEADVKGAISPDALEHDGKDVPTQSEHIKLNRIV